MNFKIPLFELNYSQEEENAVLETLRSKWISIGPKTSELEEKFANMLGVKYAVALTNSTVALHLSMVLNDIKEGDEVICPSLTFVATANAIRYVGATPIFADVKSNEDLTIDPVDIEKKITPNTKAIIVMHYGGFSCDMGVIMSLAKKYKLKIIEDACHGPLSEYKGKKLGTIGDMGTFSFFSNKNISTGEGGMLVTNNKEYYERAKLLRSHGMTTMSYERAKGHSTKYDVVELGFNYRIDDIRASLAIVQLDKLKDDLIKRADVRKMYLLLLSKNDKIIIPFSNYNEFSSNYIFPIIIKDVGSDRRDEIRDELAKAGIQTSMHYPAVHKFSIYKDYYLELPHTDIIVNNLITFPMYGNLKKIDIEYIAKQLEVILE